MESTQTINLDKERKKALKKAREHIKLKHDKARKKALYDAKEWYTFRALLGNQ